MSERPDIGKMIEEELAKGGAPEEGKKPLEVRGGSIGETAEAPSAERTAPTPEKAADANKRDLWDKERKQLSDEYSRLYAERKGRPRPPKDMLSGEELDELRAIVVQAAKENDKVSTAILKEGIAVSDEATLHPYDKGLESMTDKLLDQNGELYKQALMLLNNQPDGKEALKALTKKIGERVEQFAKRTEQLKRINAPRVDSRPPAAAAAEAQPAQAQADKKKAVAEAMKPFVDDVKRMMEGDRRKKEREAAEKKDEKPKSWWEKWFGGKKAA